MHPTFWDSLTLVDHNFGTKSPFDLKQKNKNKNKTKNKNKNKNKKQKTKNKKQNKKKKRKKNIIKLRFCSFFLCSNLSFGRRTKFGFQASYTPLKLLVTHRTQ